MSAEMGRAFFRIAVFMVVMSAILLPFLPVGSAEFVVDVVTLILGLVFVGILAFLARRSARG
jgi:hypothetical protein